ncbi:MAG TPA: hypothetical protein VFD07_09820 [Candidatus Krumholzibacteria bacterium]|nr:hypothetical protein [Candidatus Krumholzibacteria bacterium]
MHRVPGSVLPPHHAVQCGSVWPFAGSGLVTHVAALQSVGQSWGFALAVAQTQSDIHAETDATLVLQSGRTTWRAGAAATLRRTHFARHPTWAELHLQLGFGARLHTRVRLACTSAGILQRDVLPRVGLTLGVKLEERLEATLLLEREPSLPTRMCAGLAWGVGGGLGFLCGHDLLTGGSSAGLVAGPPSWKVTYATASHPELGWSHAWMLEYRR